MIVGTLRVKLHFPEAHSLKEKRFVLKSLKDRIRNKFNVAVSELGDTKDLWQIAEIGMAVVGDEQKYLNQVLDHLKNFFEASADFQLTESLVEFF